MTLPWFCINLKNSGMFRANAFARKNLDYNISSCIMDYVVFPSGSVVRHSMQTNFVFKLTKGRLVIELIQVKCVEILSEYPIFWRFQKNLFATNTRYGGRLSYWMSWPRRLETRSWCFSSLNVNCLNLWRLQTMFYLQKVQIFSY